MSNQGANVPGVVSIGEAVTGGTANSVLYIDSLGDLAQDSPHFTFDPVNNILNVGSSSDVGAYHLDTKAALFRVANVSGDNWFEGGAGNLTVTGFQNFGTGDGCLGAVTTGDQNVGLGAVALQACTTGSRNSGIGRAALFNVTSGNDNLGVGESAAWQLTSGFQNVAIGRTALGSSTVDNNCLAIGFNALSSLGSLGGAGGSNVIGVGGQAGFLIKTANGGVFIGSSTGGNATSTFADVIIGVNAGANLSGSISRNAFVGDGAGYYYTGATNCSILGSWNGNPAGGTINNIIALTTGLTLNQDWNYITSNVWSFQNTTSKVGLHVYNTLDNVFSPTNYERGVFDWNITSNVLTIGVPPSGAGGTGTLRDVYYYTGGKPAIFRIPNASGDNWFEDNAGNFTLTGHNNFGTGDGALAALTTGAFNAAMGTKALNGCTTGISNTAIGFQALGSLTSNTDNLAFGTNALLAGNGGSNVAIGSSSLIHILTGSRNTCIGQNTLATLSGGDSDNCAIGSSAGSNVTTASNSTLVGGWPGPSGGIANMIALSAGTSLDLDFNYTNSLTWTFAVHAAGFPVGLHVYNSCDSATPPTNYERALFDWNASANVLTIGTQAGGTGTVRDFAITKGGNTFLTSATTTVASLPAAGVKGRHHFVTDANATTFQSIVAGGGTNNVPVFDDGTNWRIG